MTLTSKDRYAIIALLELAAKGGSRPVPLVELSQKYNISVSYLEQLFAQLRRAGLVQSRRGPSGGYLLGRPAQVIRIYDVLRAIRSGDPVSDRRFADSGESPGLVLWEILARRIQDLLERTTLADLLRAGGVYSGRSGSDRGGLEAG